MTCDPGSRGSPRSGTERALLGGEVRPRPRVRGPSRPADGRLDPVRHCGGRAVARRHPVRGRHRHARVPGHRGPAGGARRMTELRPDELPPPAWNATARDYPVALLHEAFEAQVARTPEAPAIRFRDESLSYQELNGRANRLARYLVELGAGPGSLVAVCMDRSLEMVVSLYAILKAGAAYVPIDPEYPADRISFMLADTAAPILLTQQALVGRFAGSAARIVPVDRVTDDIADREAADVPSGAALDDLAYVIYTSGSTGQPKGAMITHRAHLQPPRVDAGGLRADRGRPRPPEDAVQLRCVGLGVLLAAPVRRGARDRGARRPPGQHATSRRSSSIAGSPRSTSCRRCCSCSWRTRGPPTARGLASVICSGEALPKALQDRFFERLPAELHNLYGPTEAAVDVTWWACDPASDLAFVPIGKPIANTQIHIVDDGPAPGAGRDRRASCASAASRSPAATSTGRSCRPSGSSRTRSRPDADARLYRTGDLSRFLPDGNIEFLGRIDFQVKIRGFRVELGEIEAALEAIPGIRQAVVVARARSSGDLELVAYVLSPDGERPANDGSASSCSPGCPSTWSRRPSSSSIGFRRPRAARSTGRPCPLRPVSRPEVGHAVRGPADPARAAHRRCVAAGPGRGVSRRARPVLRARRHLAPGRALRQRDADRAGRDDLRRNAVRRPVDRRVRCLPAGGLSHRRRPAGGRGPAANRAPAKSRAHHRGGRRPVSGGGAHAPRASPRTPTTGTRRRSSS